PPQRRGALRRVSLARAVADRRREPRVVHRRGARVRAGRALHHAAEARRVGAPRRDPRLGRRRRDARAAAVRAARGSRGAMTTFAQFADSARVGALLGQYLPEYAGPVSITRCEALRLRYRTALEEPWRSFLQASYRLHLRDSTTGQEREQIVYLKAYRDGRSASKFRQSLAAPCTHLPALDSIVWEFPNDPRMPHLRHVTDPRQVRDVLPYDALPANVRGPDDLRDVSVTIVRYKPEH